MTKKNHFDGRTMHIDVSRRFYQKGDSGVAFKIIPSQEHRGMVLTNRLKEELKRDINIDEDYAMLYSICIYYLIYDKLDSFDNLVICNDEWYVYVKQYLDLLFEDNLRYLSKTITCISELRRMMGDSKIRSYADNIANVYRRKGVKPIRRQTRGIPLNLFQVNYHKIKQKWEEIHKKMK